MLKSKNQITQANWSNLCPDLNKSQLRPPCKEPLMLMVLLRPLLKYLTLMQSTLKSKNQITPANWSNLCPDLNKSQLRPPCKELLMLMVLLRPLLKYQTLMSSMSRSKNQITQANWSNLCPGLNKSQLRPPCKEPL